MSGPLGGVVSTHTVYTTIFDSVDVDAIIKKVSYTID